MYQSSCGCLQKSSDWVPFVLIYRFCHKHRLAADREVAACCGKRMPVASTWPYLAIGGVIAGLLLMIIVFVVFLS